MHNGGSSVLKRLRSEHLSVTWRPTASCKVRKDSGGDEAGIGLSVTLESCMIDEVKSGMRLLRRLELRGVDGMNLLLMLDASRLSLCIDKEMPVPNGGLQLGT